MSVRTTLLALVTLSVTTGCNTKTTPTEPAKSDAAPSPGVTAADVFKRPAPTEAAHDPRVITLKATTERMTASLTVVRDRLTTMRAALDTKAETESDLNKVASELKTLTVQARDDCDAIMRSTKDLKAELAIAKKGYAHTADLYRDRAETLTDPALKNVQLRMADEFDRLALATPQRIELTDAFLVRLAEVQDFLAQADRCLGDTKTALDILSAGPTPVRVSAEGRAFRRHLETFLAVLDDYQRKLLAPPPVRPIPPRPADSNTNKTEPVSLTKRNWKGVTGGGSLPDCPLPPRQPDLSIVANPNAPSADVYRTHYCDVCQTYHVTRYPVAPNSLAASLEGDPPPSWIRPRTYIPGAEDY